MKTTVVHVSPPLAFDIGVDVGFKRRSLYHVASTGQVFQYVEGRQGLTLRAVANNARNAARLALIRNACAAESARIAAIA